MAKILIPRLNPHYNLALKVSFSYAIFASLWILLSDRLLLSLINDATLLTNIQTIKGWTFVAFSALFIYGLLYKKIGKLMHAEKIQLELFNSTREALFLHDSSTGEILNINQPAVDMLGYSSTEIEQLTISDLQLNRPITDTSCYHEVSGFFVRQINKKNNDPLWVEISSKPFKSKEKDQTIITVRDISVQKSTENILRTLAETSTLSNDDIFKTMAQQIASSFEMKYALIGSVELLDPLRVETLTVWSSNRFVDNICYSLAETPCEIVVTNGMSVYPDNVDQIFPEDSFITERNIKSYIGIPLKNHNDEVLGLIALLDDKPKKITNHTIDLLESLAVRATIELERKKSDEKLKLSSRVFTDTHEGIIITDPQGIIIDINPTFCAVTGYSREEVIGKNPSLLNSGKHSAEFYQDIWQTLYEKGHWKGEISNRKKNGELYVELLNISSLTNKDGEIINFVGMFTDITQTKEQQRQLEIMAHYDVLTQLPNRLLFSDRFNQACAQSKRADTALAVCFLDLDNFKPVNDTYGHTIGDRLLVEVASRIKSNIREEDTVSRQGGDEFAILLVNLESPFQGEQMLDRIQHTLSQPFYIDGHTISISASMGVTLYPSDNADLDTLLRHADQAMYQAKLNGRNNYFFFNIEDDKHSVNKHHRLQEISDALIDNQFELYYQPKVNMRTGDIVGVEALIRWQHPVKGLIPPIDFLPLIEGHELGVKIGQWVIRESIQQMEKWQNQNVTLQVSINIASQHLLTPNFYNELDTALAQHPAVDSQYLQLEILESSVLSDLDTITSVLLECQKDFGVSFALDDFGTGYSSLTHLRNLPVNTVKIDKSFVTKLLDDPNDYAIIDGLIGLTNSFNLELIAEGVETNEIGLMLLTMGCDIAQGYGIARPMPASHFKQWFYDYSPNTRWKEQGSEELNLKQKQVSLCQIVIQDWKNKLEHSLLSPSNTGKEWPTISPLKCHCSSWIRKQRQINLIDSQLINKFDVVHERLHAIANEIYELHEQYKPSSPDTHTNTIKMKELEDSFNIATTILEECSL